MQGKKGRLWHLKGEAWLLWPP